MNRGGKREGSGRKSRYGVPTTTIRIPINIKTDVLAFIEQRMAGGALDDSVSESKSGDRPVDSKPETIEAWEHSGRRCQASTAKGERCGNKRGLMIVESILPDGGTVKLSVCARHKRKWEIGELLPHPSCLRETTKTACRTSFLFYE